ncbi:hypothetical protein GOP47_0015913 [Adiantum capillus-veneris]|uniref:Uncharacterized protein n=1 Tax=Adiantum capillus-veneris TaxID=13818 RepID=A0A9D4ULD0_ADICA|nr:hypothetical protein GOP47_0015913 [Adiantum capillus-veneris]
MAVKVVATSVDVAPFMLRLKKVTLLPQAGECGELHGRTACGMKEKGGQVERRMRRRLLQLMTLHGGRVCMNGDFLCYQLGRRRRVGCRWHGRVPRTVSREPRGCR